MKRKTLIRSARSFLLALMLVLAVPFVSACQEEKSAGEKLEEGIEEIGNEIENAADEIEDEIDDAT